MKIIKSMEETVQVAGIGAQAALDAVAKSLQAMAEATQDGEQLTFLRVEVTEKDSQTVCRCGGGQARLWKGDHSSACVVKVPHGKIIVKVVMNDNDKEQNT